MACVVVFSVWQTSGCFMCDEPIRAWTEEGLEEAVRIHLLNEHRAEGGWARVLESSPPIHVVNAFRVLSDEMKTRPYQKVTSP